jgi:hypothetical protein
MTEFDQEMRKMCRNPRCRSKLPAPVSNEREAFCVRGCYSGFYLHRCRVCEEALPKTSKGRPRLICKKAKCRNAWNAGEGFGKYADSAERYPVSRNPEKSAGNAANAGGFERGKPARGWRIVAGAELSPTSFRFATLPLDDATADRVSRVNRGYWKEACRAAEERTVLKRHHPPVNILGGYKFPDAPDLWPPASPPASEPMPIVGDGLDIPDFLLLRPHQNQMRMAA